MIDRLDHVVIAVRDLDAASQSYRDALGFEVRPGGRHVGRVRTTASCASGSITWS